MNALKDILEKLFHEYKGDTPKLLGNFGAIGLACASIANIIGIRVNEKLGEKEKKFLIPQEAANGAINVGMFFVITRGLTELTRFTVEHLEKTGEIEFAKNTKGAIGGIVMVASLAGSIIANNILTPIIRNKYAAGRQKRALGLIQDCKISDMTYPNSGQMPVKTMSMSAFLTYAKNPGLKI